MLQHLAITNVKPKGNFYNQTFQETFDQAL